MNCEYCKTKLNPDQTCRDLCDKVSFYTLSKGDPFFIHQLVVDAYGAQHASGSSKPIGVAFALIGLYLFAERGYTGRQAQLAHMQLGKVKRKYPKFVLPDFRGDITVADVLKGDDQDRDEKIKAWARSVWEAFSENRPLVLKVLKDADFVEIK